MFNFPLTLFSFVLLFSISTTTTAQPYKSTDYFLLNCGGATATSDNRKWDTDERSEFMPSTTSFTSAPNNRDASVPQIPYSIARIFNTSSFTYTFPVTNGPKFLRLYFYPATYSHYSADQSFFSVSSNGYSLLSNFSAFLTASYLGTTLGGSPPVPNFIKEFIIYVKDTQSLNVTFTPSPNSYAFINGIEIVSLPENLYYKSKNLKYVGQITGTVITEDTGLENIYRLNVGGNQIPPTNDTGMYRSWDQDYRYLLAATGLKPVNNTPIVYTAETPNYTAPELVYATQRSMGVLSEYYNLTWLLPVDSGFEYMLRLHFCNIIPQYSREDAVSFRIFINNQTAEENADIFYWTHQGTGVPVFKDYAIFVYDFDGSGRKQDLWLAIGPSRDYYTEYNDAFLNGLEVFKLSKNGSLAGPNPELRPTSPPPPPPSPPGKKRTPPYAAIIGGIGGALVLMLSILGFIVFGRVKHSDDKSSDEQKSKDSGLPSDWCRRFTIQEVKDATGEFDKTRVIGRGGFGMVYKGYIDNGTTVVAIKRLNALSKQGIPEFETEIRFLSKLRHVQLVSLIGYCDDEGEKVLVYDYMSHGTLQDHLYKGNNPHLPWKRRLEICIGAAKGLHYLHTGVTRAIIHRDVKSSNILLDKNWVAKLADFGLSKLGPKEKGVDHVNTLVKGTPGYLDPEYYKLHQLTEKSDVYSFGVVLLEVLCSRPAIINQRVPDKEVNLAEWGRLNYGKGTLHEIVDKKIINQRVPDEEVNLAEWGRLNYGKGTLREIVDEKIRGEIAANCLIKFGEVANSCLSMEGSSRPKMDDVVCGLKLALQFQEAADKTDDEVLGEMKGGSGMSENQEYMFLVKGEDVSTVEEYEYELEGSTAMGIQHGSTSTDGSSHEVLVSKTVLH